MTDKTTPKYEFGFETQAREAFERGNADLDALEAPLGKDVKYGGCECESCENLRRIDAANATRNGSGGVPLEFDPMGEKSAAEYRAAGYVAEADQMEQSAKRQPVDLPVEGFCVACGAASYSYEDCAQCGRKADTIEVGAAILKNCGLDESAMRKMMPIGTLITEYFPDAFLGMAAVAYVGNQKHNPGEHMHWARGKSMDQFDCVVRHSIDAKRAGADGWDTYYLKDGSIYQVRHKAAAAWRAAAEAQLDAESAGGEVLRVLALPNKPQ